MSSTKIVLTSLDMSRWTAFLVFSCFFRPLCSGYWQVQRGRQFLPMFPLCFSQIQSSSSWSGERSCGNPDLLMISSYSCTVPLSWPKWHARRWSLISPVHSESFINLAEDSLQTEASLVSKKHLHAILHLQAFQKKTKGQRVHPQWLMRTSVVRDSAIFQL